MIGSSSVRTLYLLSIVCARKSILIANPYFVPDGAAVEALKDARRRGVDVQVMVSGAQNDHWLARHNSVRISGRLLEVGVSILEYDTTMLHHKIMIVDGKWATIGTANFDNRSFGLNDEVNVAILQKALAAGLEADFAADLAESAAVTLEEWRRRALAERAFASFARLLERQA